jgi:hypothetical protein
MLHEMDDAVMEDGLGSRLPLPLHAAHGSPPLHVPPAHAGRGGACTSDESDGAQFAVELGLHLRLGLRLGLTLAGLGDASDLDDILPDLSDLGILMDLDRLEMDVDPVLVRILRAVDLATSSHQNISGREHVAVSESSTPLHSGRSSPASAPASTSTSSISLPLTAHAPPHPAHAAASALMPSVTSTPVYALTPYPVSSLLAPDAGLPSLVIPPRSAAASFLPSSPLLSPEVRAQLITHLRHLSAVELAQLHQQLHMRRRRPVPSSHTHSHNTHAHSRSAPSAEGGVGRVMPKSPAFKASAGPHSSTLPMASPYFVLEEDSDAGTNLVANPSSSLHKWTTEPSFRDPGYFLMLEDLPRQSSPPIQAATISLASPSPSLASASVQSAAPKLAPTPNVSPDVFNEHYFSRFFRQVRKLGSGASGSVFLCHHYLDTIFLGTFAVKVWCNFVYLARSVCAIICAALKPLLHDLLSSSFQHISLVCLSFGCPFHADRSRRRESNTTCSRFEGSARFAALTPSPHNQLSALMA